MGITANLASGGEIEHCEFVALLQFGLNIFDLNAEVRINECLFESIGDRGASIRSGGQGYVTDCVFHDCHYGVDAEFGTSVLVQNCRFTGEGVISILVYGSSAQLYENYCNSTDIRNVSSHYSVLSGSDNVFLGGAETTFYLQGSYDVDMSNNNILNNGGYTIWCASYFQQPATIHLEENYWGTTDLEEISDWIWDGSDDPGIRAVVEYEPILMYPVGVESPPRATAKLAIRPNPFNPRTELVLELGRTSVVRLEVYDLRGRLICRLVDGAFNAGTHTVTWDGTDTHGRPVPSGRYFARLEAGGEVVTRSMTLVR
jgi:hypothetical protein